MNLIDSSTLRVMQMKLENLLKTKDIRNSEMVKLFSNYSIYSPYMLT